VRTRELQEGREQWADEKRGREKREKCKRAGRGRHKNVLDASFCG
jgi:hypothetical protein